MTLFLASIVLGIVPMVIYALIVWRLDRWEKEPFPLMLAAFCWGAIPSVIFAIIAQNVLNFPALLAEGEPVSIMAELYQASLVAPVTEELLKGLGVWLILVLFRKEVDSILDGLIYGSMVGFGFSAVENILYFSGQPDAASLMLLFFMRAFIFGMLHALFTGLTGVGFALGKFSRRPAMKILWPILGLSLAIFTHALHNYFATLGGENIAYAVLGISLGTIWFAVTVVVCLVHENRWIRIQLSPEVANGVLYAGQALDAAAFWTRSSLSVFNQGFKTVFQRKRLLHQATELAYKKQRILNLGSTPERENDVIKLREDVRRLSRMDPLVTSGIIKPDRLLPPPLPPVRAFPPPIPKSGGNA